MATKLANIHFKYNQWGSSLHKQFITPAELMLLIAMHSSNVGGNPIITLEVLPDDAEEKPIKEAMAKINELTKRQEVQNNKEDITEEIRTVRIESLQRQIDFVQGTIDSLRARQQLRNLNPVEERRRLAAKYGAKVVGSTFPGSIPVFPQDFKSAQEGGLSAEIVGDRFLVMEGDTGA